MKDFYSAEEVKLVMMVLSLSFEIFSTYKKNNAINMMNTEAINETLIELKLSANKRLKSTIINCCILLFNM